MPAPSQLREGPPIGGMLARPNPFTVSQTLGGRTQEAAGLVRELPGLLALLLRRRRQRARVRVVLTFEPAAELYRGYGFLATAGYLAS